MRINRLHIDRFGILADQAVPALSPGLTCFLGKNEAGKSTCLRFFRSMLFGYRRGKSNLDPLSEKTGKTLAAGSGGSLFLGTATEGELILTRRPGRHGGPFSIADAQGALLPDDVAEALLSRLFSGMTMDVFDAIFAFSLNELMEFSSFSGEKVRHALHGAAFGQGLRSPAEVLKRLNDRMSVLLKERGSAAINNAWNELKTVREALQDREPEVALYASLNAELETLDAGLAALRAGREAQELLLRSTRRRKDLWRQWEELGRVRAELTGLSELTGMAGLAGPDSDAAHGPAFAPDAVQRLDALLARREERLLAVGERERAIARLDEDIARLAQRAGPNGSGPDGYGQGGAQPDGTGLMAGIQPLREQKERRRAEAESLPGLLAERARLESAQEEALAALGPGWDVHRAAGLDLSLAAGQSLLDRGAAVRRLAERLDRLSDDCRRLREERDEATAQEEEAGRGLPPALSPQDALPDKATAVRLSAAMAEAAAALAALPGLLNRRDKFLAEARLALADIDPSLTAETLRGMDRSPAARLVLTGAASRLLAAASARDRAEQGLRLAEEREQAALARVETLQERMAAHTGLPDEADLAQRRLALGRLREALSELATARRAATELRLLVEENDAKPSLPLANNPLFLAGAQLCLVGVALGGGGLAGAFPALLYAGAALLALGLPLCLLYRLAARTANDGENAPRTLRQACERTEEQAAALEKELETLRQEGTPWPGDASDPDAAFPPDREALDRALQALEELGSALALAGRDRAELAEAEDALALAKRETRTAEEAYRRAETEREQALAAHDKNISGLGLSRSVPPEDVKALFEAVSAALVRDDAAREATERAASAAAAITACFSAAASHPFFASALQQPGDNTDASLLTDPAALERPEARDAAAAGLEALGRAMTALEALAEQEQERRRFASILRERQEARERIERRLALAESARDEAREALDAALQAWREGLASFGLGHDLSPESASDALALMRGVVGRDKDIRTCRERIAALEKALAAFTDEVVAQARAMGVPVPAPLASSDQVFRRIPTALTLLDELAARAEEAAMTASQHADRQEQRARLARELEGAAEALALTESALAELLNGAGLTDAESFRAAFARHSRLERLRSEERGLVDALRRLAAEEGVSLEELQDFFAQSSPEALGLQEKEFADSLARLDADMAARSQQRGALVERRAVLAGEREAGQNGADLKGADGTAELRRREAGLKEDLRRLSRQWAVPALARELLLAAKERFEKEGRRGVLRHAGDMFLAVTGGEYTGITIGLDGESFTAMHRSGDVRDPEKQLSQGTREQLYLALRLAFIKNHAEKAEPMPVFMDDILVNFDPDRAAATAGILAGFAAENQLLFFTCHPETADMLMAAASNGAPAPLLYRIDKGVISAA